MEINEMRKKLKDSLKKSRYEHSVGVEYTAAALAMRYGCDVNKALIAGLLHDCAKNIDDDEQLKLCKKNGLKCSESEKKLPFLLHAKLGAFLAKKVYGVEDEEILNAIRYHTTGCPDMTMLEKIIFTADYIEPGRTKASRLGEIRRAAFEDIDAAILMIFEDTISYINDKFGKEYMDGTTLAAYEFMRGER